ncbi:choice-of-anchor M domain-containing protein [Roseibacillus ishigakijimensis]|uniref:choice-of-anchor M domain-containing protein n=1 Tax=Roseibacillus ishigakijimensis TaxID=454146 RepID=UPI0019031D6E|nr:choice-of-anchor M domain-containing protein [Roseibacillus ishigakijimensis]
MSSPLPAVDLIYGHYEVHTDYDPDEGWSLVNSYNLNDDFNDRSQIRRLAAAETRLIAPPRSEGVLTDSLSFLGEVGQKAWILPQSFQVGNQYLGMRVIVDPFVFQTRVGNFYSNSGIGTISLRLVAATGTGMERGGHFALWENGNFGEAEVYYNTADGLSAEDEIPTLPAAAHSHFNWGFTAPGTYELELEAMGRLRGTGTETRAAQVFQFVVPHSGVLSSFSGSILHQQGRWELALRDEAGEVLYGERRAVVEVPASTTGAGYQCAFLLEAGGGDERDVVGLPRELATAGAADSFASVDVQLVHHLGPGELVVGELLSTADGLDGDDSLSLTSDVEGILHFTEKGIHTLTFELRGRDEEGLVVSRSQGVVRCLAGLRASYSFAEWADSYERAHQLAAGSLADPAGDWNGDGRSHQWDYLMDAAGANPVTGASASVCAQLSPDGGEGRLIFLRDLYKDPLAGQSPRLVSEASQDLELWATIEPTAPGYPLELFETGAEEGNALSKFMMRALKRETPPSGRDFFRLRVK